MGEVFLVRDLAAGRLCALKRLKGASRTRPAALRREFETLARLRHPSIVAVYDFAFAPDGTPFYTMEYVAGRSLDLLLPARHWHDLLAVGAEIAHGLEVLHAEGIVHGDLKPSNVLALASPGHDGSIAGIRLVDFGLSAVLGEAAGAHHGTSGFAAPEIVRGESATVSSDLYALGATLFVLGCGRPPFRDENGETLLRSQQRSAPDREPLEASGAPPALVELALQLLAPDARTRPQSARDVRRELESMDPSIRRSLGERLGNAALVGREPQLAAIEPLLGRTLSRSRLVLVLGPKGMGKSAFVAEVAARAALAGHPVVRFSGPTIAPAESVLREFGSSSETPGATLDELLDRQVQSLAVGDLAHHPVYLIDDADALDAFSRRLLRRVLLHPDMRPTVWVLARDASTATPEDERALVSAGLVDVLRLGPLDQHGVTQVVGARLRDVPPARLTDFLWRVGQGHPGLTIEALRLAARAGVLEESDAGLVVDGEGLDRLGASESLETARHARMRDLPETSHRALHVLAVVGAATGEELARIEAGVDAAALADLRDRGFVSEGPGGRLQLAWPMQPDRLDSAEVQHLHRAALALEGRSSAERFRHLHGAGELEKALEAATASLAVASDPMLSARAADVAESMGPQIAAAWHERTARDHIQHGQYESAVPHLERAIRLDPNRERCLERLLLLSSAHLRLGAADRAEAVVREANALEPPIGLRARFLTNESSRLQSLGHVDRAEAVARDALELGQRAGDREAEGAAAQSLVYILLAQGRTSEAMRLADLAVVASRDGGSAFGRARAVGARAAVAHAQQEHEHALELYRSALEEARSERVSGVVEELLINQSIVLCELGRWGEFRQRNAEALRLALEDHRPRNAAVAMANLAHADALTGQPRRARREARSAIRLARRHLPALEASAWRALAHAERISGRLGSAEKATRRAVDLASDRSSAEELAWCRLEHGRVCAARGRWTEALAAWRSGWEELPPAGSRVLACLLAASVGEAGLHTRQLEHAAEALDRIAELTSRGPGSPHARGFALRLRAGLAIREGRLEAGMRAGAEALAAMQLVPAPADHAGTALVLAQLALERPDAHAVPLREWLEEAAAGCERLGDSRGRERALLSLVEWFRRRSDSAAGARSNRALFEAVSDLLTSLSDLRELAERAMRLVVEQLSAERGVFLLIDPASGQLVPLAEHGALDAAARREVSGFSRRVVARVAESGGSVLVSDAPLDPLADSPSVTRLRLRSILCAPLSAAGRVVGAVYLDDSRRPRAFDESDRQLLEGIASLLAVAVDRSLGQQEIERTNEMLVGENRTLRREVASRFRTQELIGTSLALQRILPLVERAAAINTNVLLMGESGTGKELIARIIHSNGKRRFGPFVAVNCGALTETLVESELFGILPNVATGVRGRDGFFRQADGGTLFLDEIGDMPLRQQVTLFSAIANREIYPVGGGRPIAIDVRIIAATNRNLRQMVEERTFREELFYRLHVFPIEVPPLRDRKADIPQLARHFVAQFAMLQERDVPKISSDLLAALMRSQWQGNVREFQNYIEQVMAMTSGTVLFPRPLPVDLEKRAAAIRHGKLADQVEALERRLLQDALERCAGNQSLAARELGIPEPGVRYRMRKYGIAGNRQKRRIRLK